MSNTINIKNKVILITGGYGFLGKAITLGLLSEGAKVFLLGREESKFNQQFHQYLDNVNLFFIKCDVSSTDEIKNSFKTINRDFPIDVLINNAFYSKGQSPENMDDSDWAYGIDGTLNSCFRCIREIIPFLKDRGGKIINVSSMYGLVAPQFEVYDDYPQYLNPPHYGAAKAGIIQMTKYYASYLGKYNITVNAITPGPFPSEEVQRKSNGFIKELEKRTCLERIGKPEDLVGAFVYLSSSSSSYITGQNLIIDGGWTSK